MLGDSSWRSRRRRTEVGATSVRVALTLLLPLLAIAFLAITGLRIVHPESLNSDRAAATRVADRDDDVTAAARRATLAFLDVDYRDMRPRIKTMLDLSTGEFKALFDRKSPDLIAGARSGRTVSVGSVRYIGIAESRGSSAVALVAADSTFSNVAMEQARKKGEKVNDHRYYRFRLVFTKVGDSWLVNDLRYVS